MPSSACLKKEAGTEPHLCFLLFSKQRIKQAQSRTCASFCFQKLIHTIRDLRPDLHIPCMEPSRTNKVAVFARLDFHMHPCLFSNAFDAHGRGRKRGKLCQGCHGWKGSFVFFVGSVARQGECTCIVVITLCFSEVQLCFRVTYRHTPQVFFPSLHKLAFGLRSICIRVMPCQPD